VSVPCDDDRALLAGLRRGDEEAFAALIDRYHSSLVRVARSYVATREAAEDVVQETWLGVVSGIDRFEGRSSLKTWIFRILVNRAKTRGAREARTRPFSSLVVGDDDDEPSVDPARFFTSGRWAGYWSVPPSGHQVPEDSVVLSDLRREIRGLIERLPVNQRLVITLRDVQGLTSNEVCELLEISEVNQRVLLHRARSKVRAGYERVLAASAEVG
jgi:RNA polymerase sigma-70 factor (ECF subfamily)